MNTIIPILLMLVAGAVCLSCRPWLSRTRRVENRRRKFGEATDYLAIEVMHEGSPTELLLTEAELNDGILRAIRQPEDTK